MVEVTNRAAVDYVNAYLRDRQEIQDFFGPDDPFWPIQTQPETTVPYIRYTSSISVADQWWVSAEDVSYAIYEFDIDKIHYITNLLKDILRRQDETARDINKWCQANNFNDFKYYTFRVQGIGSPQPPEEEANPIVRVFNFTYDYSIREGTGLN